MFKIAWLSENSDAEGDVSREDFLERFIVEPNPAVALQAYQKDSIWPIMSQDLANFTFQLIFTYMWLVRNTGFLFRNWPKTLNFRMSKITVKTFLGVTPSMACKIFIDTSRTAGAPLFGV